MADIPQAAPQQATPLGAPAARGPGKKSIVAKLATSVAGHAYASLAIIVVLLILVIGLYVYYHGLFFLGPYASAKKGGFRPKKKKGGDDSSAEDAPGPSAKGDPETERLIDSINRN